MILEVSLKNGGLVELTGSTAKYWEGEGLPTYEGAIEGLPECVIAELLTLKAIKSK